VGAALDGIPATATARTLLDLASVLPFHELESCYADARTRGLVHKHELLAALGRGPRRHGAGALRRLLELDECGGPTRSVAERRFLRLVRTAGLPAPETNARIGGFEVDVVWRRHRFVVEVDGVAFHSGQEAFERDRVRDAMLMARGYAVSRVTWRQLNVNPVAVIARLAAALATRESISS
jgi:very-short-patch-repair endonuclease